MGNLSLSIFVPITISAGVPSKTTFVSGFSVILVVVDFVYILSSLNDIFPIFFDFFFVSVSNFACDSCFLILDSGIFL